MNGSLSAETEIFTTSRSNLVSVGIGKKITDPVLTNQKVLAARWLAFFDSTEFAFSTDVSFNRGLKWSFFGDILLSLIQNLMTNIKEISYFFNLICAMKQLPEEEKTAIPDLSSLMYLVLVSCIQDQTQAHIQECENPTKNFWFHTFCSFLSFLILLHADLESIVFSSQHSLFSVCHFTVLVEPSLFRSLYFNRLPWWRLILFLLLCCKEAILTFMARFRNWK